MLQIAQPAFYAKVAQLGHNALHKDVFQHAQQSTCHTLGQLQHHIAHKAVADDNVHLTSHNITRLNVAHKADGRVCFQQAVGFAVHRGALGVLGAVVHQRDGGVLAAHDLIHVHAAHGAKGIQHLGTAFGVCAAVQQQKRLLFARHAGSQRRALDPLDGAHDQTGAHMQRAGGTGRNKGIRLTVFQHRQAFDQAGIRFVAHGLDRVIVHIHILGAVNQLKGGQVHAKLLGSGLDLGFITQQGQGHAVTKLFYRVGCTLYGRFRGVIAAHCVQ